MIQAGKGLDRRSDPSDYGIVVILASVGEKLEKGRLKPGLIAGHHQKPVGGTPAKGTRETIEGAEPSTGVAKGHESLGRLTAHHGQSAKSPEHLSLTLEDAASAHEQRRFVASLHAARPAAV